MTRADFLRLRLHTQHITQAPLHRPQDVVRWLGAVQAQDYPAAKWALGLRTRNTTDASLDEAFDRGEILRTHILRPTWHFVLPADIGWMLRLTAPRVKAATVSFNRYYELDEKLFARSEKVLRRALAGGRSLTRRQIAAELQRAGIVRSGDTALRIVGLLMRAEQDAVICSGPRAGKEFTYALLEERAPAPAIRDLDEAASELARRYFTSHGPATVKDFAWWSGLTARAARAALDSTSRTLESETVDGTTFWWGKVKRPPRGVSAAHLLPCYDESLLSYRGDSGALGQKGSTGGPREYGPTIVADGRILGTWARVNGTSGVTVRLKPYAPIAKRDAAAISAAADGYGRFLGRRVALS